jgi:hypothetical protein
MSTADNQSNLDDDQLSEVVKSLDQINSFTTHTQKTYYVLKELDESKESRIVLKDLREQLPLDDLRRKKPDYQNNENRYVEVDGEYFPDFLEENGVFLVSEPFMEYLRNTLHLREQYIRNYIGLCAEENERIETYCLLVPPLLDCILPGSVRLDKNNRITYLEID